MGALAVVFVVGAGSVAFRAEEAACAAQYETFGNTYYFFPKESSYERTDLVPLHDPECQVIADVPAAFLKQLKIQGSGQLSSGQTVSYGSHSCGCGDDDNGHSFCFDVLSKKRFPWGRGAMGTPVKPLRTIAVDRKVIPLGTPVFVKEFVGAPITKGGEKHDGCFVAADVGGGVRGNHIDIFTGPRVHLNRWSKWLPSWSDVSVQVDAPQCHYLLKK